MRTYVEKIPATAKPIKNSKDYVDRDGSIYTYLLKTKCVIKKELRKNQGYLYGGIYDNSLGQCKTRRINRVVAETFIPNPQSLPVVGHRNNIKTDNRVENLYWTTYSENTQKAVNDGLLVNDKGEDDSQSMPVSMYDTETNRLLGTYGSIKEAARETGCPANTIARQAKYHRPTRRPWYFRYIDDDATLPPNSVVVQCDYNTDEELARFVNANQAATATGYHKKTIMQQCHQGKPKHKFSDVYFKFAKS